MGLIGRIVGMGGAREIGAAVGGVAEIFVGNQAERDEAAEARLGTAVEQFGAEFAATAGGRFDGFVNGLNRLPRPMLALGTFGLFAYAMAEPAGFGLRMQGLALVPEPLWWLLGAIVSFYFGARELHHQRAQIGTRRAPPTPTAAEAGIKPTPLAASTPARAAVVDPDFNAAVEEWRMQRG